MEEERKHQKSDDLFDEAVRISDEREELEDIRLNEGTPEVANVLYRVWIESKIRKDEEKLRQEARRCRSPSF